MVATGPVQYIGQKEIHRDIANLREALQGKRYVEAFMAADADAMEYLDDALTTHGVTADVPVRV